MTEQDEVEMDHELAITRLSREELKLGLECAVRMRTHLKKHVKNESRYLSNLSILEVIIEKYEQALDDDLAAL